MCGKEFRYGDIVRFQTGAGVVFTGSLVRQDRYTITFRTPEGVQKILIKRWLTHHNGKEVSYKLY